MEEGKTTEGVSEASVNVEGTVSREALELLPRWGASISVNALLYRGLASADIAVFSMHRPILCVYIYSHVRFEC